jgi:membrane protein
MAFAARLDAAQRRHRRLGFPLAVVYKYFDDQGGYLAALIAYYGFLSLFPLLLLLSSILGFVLRGDPHEQHAILHSALAQFPVIGGELGNPKRLGGSVTGTVIGVLGSLYGGLGVAQAAQNAMNTAWAVPKNSRPNPFQARGRSLLLLGTVGLAVLGTTILSAIGASAGSFGSSIGIGFKILLTAASVAINAGIFFVGFRIATARALTVNDILPGAIAAAIGWQLVESFGAAYVGHVVKHASATNSVFAIVLGLIALLYLEAVIVVICVEANVVRSKNLYPRALLTPFTDNVSLTQGDEQTYADSAQAQRNKGFETIDVTFHDRNPDDRDSG